MGDGNGKFGIYVRLSPRNFLVTNTEDNGTFDCILFSKKGREFPRYDCFIACKNLFCPDDSQVEGKVGELDDDELKTLHTKISTSFYLTPNQINDICGAITAELTKRAKDRAPKT